MTVIIFIIVLAVLIFVHELGHFLLAKWNGIRVDEFKIGFGPKLLWKKYGETTYGINLIPFGGYVKIHGENPEEETSKDEDSRRSFVNKNKIQQILVLVAGVVFNFIFAWIIYSAAYTSGINTTALGHEKYSRYISDQKISILQVSKGSPAEKVGLKVGDVLVPEKIIKIPNESTLDPDAKIVKIQEYINDSKGENINLVYKRNNDEYTVVLKPVSGLVKDRYAVGIAMGNVVSMKLPIHLAIYEGGKYTLYMIRETAVGLYNFVANIFVGKADFGDVAGPVGIAGIVGDAASMGFVYLAMITAIISINLGVINLVPFPALDGGRILFVIIEAIIRRKIPAKFFNIVNTIGFVLLMILMVVVTYRDILKLFHN